MSVYSHDPLVKLNTPTIVVRLSKEESILVVEDMFSKGDALDLSLH